MTFSTSLAGEFRNYAQKIADLIYEEGIVYRPYSHPSLPFFHRLQIPEQIEAIKNLKNFMQICLAVKKEGARLGDNRVGVEKALEAFGLTIQGSDREVIQPRHVIEIYNLSQVQIFRGFRHLELSSYTLEDIYCRKWHHLYGRSPKDHTAMLETVSNFMQMSKKKATKTNLPEHKIWEKDSLERLTLFVQTQWLIPLYHNSDFAAVMVLQLPRVEGIL